jgi:hypothetical protein
LARQIYFCDAAIYSRDPRENFPEQRRCWQVLIDRNNIVIGAYFDFHNRDYFREKITPLLNSVPGPPQLSFQRSGKNLILWWSTNAAGYVLQTSTTTLSSAVWTPVTSGVSLSNGVYRIVWASSSSNSNRYFRLRK